MKATVKGRFRQHQQLRDVNLIDILRCKADMELQETLQGFKTKSHIYRCIMPEKDAEQAIVPDSLTGKKDSSDFLRDFYAGYSK